MREYCRRMQVTVASLTLCGMLVIAASGVGGGGGSSTPRPNPVPSITSLYPSSATAGAAAQTLTINGTNFLPRLFRPEDGRAGGPDRLGEVLLGANPFQTGSTVTFNGVAHPATFVSSTQLRISLSASDQATAGIYPVVVTNPRAGWRRV